MVNKDFQNTHKSKTEAKKDKFVSKFAYCHNVRWQFGINFV